MLNGDFSGFGIDLDYIKNCHPVIYEKYILAFLFLHEKNEWTADECIKTIGQDVTSRIIKNIITAEREKKIQSYA